MYKQEEQDRTIYKCTKDKLNKLMLRNYWSTLTILRMIHFLISTENIFYLTTQQQLFSITRHNNIKISVKKTNTYIQHIPYSIS